MKSRNHFKFLVAFSCLMILSIVTVDAQTDWSVPRGETIIIGVDSGEYSNFTSMNPIIGNNEYLNGYLQIGQEYLFVSNYATGELIPWLAESYEYNDDYTQMTIFLREGIRWNDGEAFNAEDIIYTFDLLVGPGPDHPTIESIEALDDYTVVINRKTANPRFVNAFEAGIFGFSIYPQHILSEVEDLENFDNFPPVSTSVWKLREAVPELNAFIWERNDDYWGQDVFGMPEAKYLIYTRSAPTEDEIYEDFINGDTDHPHNMSWELMELALIESPDTVDYMTFQDPCPRAIAFNTSRPPLDNVDIRWAISRLIDRDYLASELWSPPSVAARQPWADWGSLQPYVVESTIEEYAYTYDVDAAIAILEENGFFPGEDGIRVDAEGNRLSFEIITPVGEGGFEYQAAEYLVDEGAAIGIEFSINNEAFWDKRGAGEFDLTSEWLCAVTNDPLQLYELFTDGENYIGYSNERLLELTNEMTLYPPDAPEVQDAYTEAFELWMAEIPIVPTIQNNFFQAWGTQYWTNWPDDSNPYAVPAVWWASFYLIPFELESVN